MEFGQPRRFREKLPGIDHGWNYNPGAESLMGLAERAEGAVRRAEAAGLQETAETARAGMLDALGVVLGVRLGQLLARVIAGSRSRTGGTHHANRQNRDRGRFAEGVVGPRGLSRLMDRPDSDTVVVAQIDESTNRYLRVGDGEVKLSAATYRKQSAVHPDVRPADYAALPAMISKGELRAHGSSHIYVLQMRDGEPWYAVVKRTASGRSAYLVSYRRSHAADLERRRTDSRLIRKER